MVKKREGVMGNNKMFPNRLRDPEAWKPYIKESYGKEFYCNSAAKCWISYLDKSSTELNLCSNRLIKLPSEIWSLEGMELLNLSDNCLEEIPAEIVQLTELKILYLTHNNLKDLPRELLSLENLEVVHRWGNNFEDEKLQAICVNQNALPYLKERAMRSIKSAGKR